MRIKNAMFFKWKLIQDCTERFGWTERAKVPGGWLVRTLALGDQHCDAQGNLIPVVSPAISMYFIKDPNHDWVIKKCKKN